jgi:hypothetical protein
MKKKKRRFTADDVPMLYAAEKYHAEFTKQVIMAVSLLKLEIKIGKKSAIDVRKEAYRTIKEELAHFKEHNRFMEEWRRAYPDYK